MSFTDRFDWAIDMQKQHALDLYKSYWDADAIIEVDDEGQADTAMQHLDFSGLDKVIVQGTKTFHIAQRFRPMRSVSYSRVEEPDFSIRESTYGDKPTEYDKLVDNHQAGGWVPNVYGFGITPYGRQVALDDGFEKFYLIDVRVFLDQHLAGEIEPVGNRPNGDGSRGLYFDIDDLADNGCIIDEISGVNND